MLWALLLLAPPATLLVVPVTVDISIRRNERFELSVSARWGPFALPSSAKTSSREAVEAPHTAPAARAGPSRTQRRKLRALLFSRDFVASLFRLLRRLLQHIHTRDLDLRLKAGLGDPADTGRLWAKLMPVFGLLWALDARSIRVEPEFSRRCLELDARATVRLVPGVSLVVLLGYCLTPPPWRALSKYLRAR